jgi:hypothetical protein
LAREQNANMIDDTIISMAAKEIIFDVVLIII